MKIIIDDIFPMNLPGLPVTQVIRSKMTPSVVTGIFEQNLGLSVTNSSIPTTHL